jgi:hypothetical protein
MRAVLLGVLAAALLTGPVDAESDNGKSANHLFPACQKFIASSNANDLGEAL